MKPLTWSMLDLGSLSAWGECDVVIKLLVKGGHSPQCPDKEEEIYFSRQEQPKRDPLNLHGTVLKEVHVHFKLANINSCSLPL